MLLAYLDGSVLLLAHIDELEILRKASYILCLTSIRSERIIYIWDVYMRILMLILHTFSAKPTRLHKCIKFHCLLTFKLNYCILSSVLWLQRIQTEHISFYNITLPLTTVSSHTKIGKRIWSRLSTLYIHSAEHHNLKRNFASV